MMSIVEKIAASSGKIPVIDWENRMGSVIPFREEDLRAWYPDIDPEEFLEIRPRARKMLDESGATEVCQSVKAAFWPLGSIREVLVLNEHYKSVEGLGLKVRSRAWGSEYSYGGDFFVVAADPDEEVISIYSGGGALAVQKTEDEWTETQRQGLKMAIDKAFSTPGRYRWRDGMDREHLDFRQPVLIDHRPRSRR